MSSSISWCVRDTVFSACFEWAQSSNIIIIVTSVSYNAHSKLLWSTFRSVSCLSNLLELDVFFNTNLSIDIECPESRGFRCFFVGDSVAGIAQGLNCGVLLWVRDRANSLQFVQWDRLKGRCEDVVSESPFNSSEFFWAPIQQISAKVSQFWFLKWF